MISISKETLQKRFVPELLAMDRSNKTFFLSSIWTDFAQNYADTLNFRLTKSAFNKEQWRERLELIHGRRGDCYPGVQVLGWDEELAEITINEVLNNLEIERQEIPELDDAVALTLSLLPNVEAYIAFQELRCNRENYPLPLEVNEPSKKYELDYITSDNSYRGWVRAAYIEQQWIFDESSYSKEAKEIIEVQSALAIEPNGIPAPEGTPPIYLVDDISWEDQPQEGLLHMGLCFGIGEYRTFLGEIQVLIPHPNLISTLNLSSSSLFTLKDETEEDVVVFRNWQKIYENSYDTDVVELQGYEVLMHPKLIDKIIDITGGKIIMLKVRHRDSVSNPMKRK